MTSDPTAKHAIRNVMTRDALINCDFSGDVLDGVDHPEVYMKDAYILRDMRRDYKLFNSQLCILGKDQEYFVKYISKEITLVAIAQDLGISYETVQQNMTRNKNLLRVRLLDSWKENWEVSHNGRSSYYSGKAVLYRKGITGNIRNQQAYSIRTVKEE